MATTKINLEQERSLVILDSLANILTQVKPEILKQLGSIATVACEGPEQDYAYGVSDAAEAARSTLDEILSAINSISTRPVQVEAESVVVPEPVIGVSQPVKVAPQSLGSEEQHIGYETVKQSPNHETEPEQVDDVHGLISAHKEELGLSTNEANIVLQVASYLRGFEDRKGLREITQAVFNSSKLSRKEESRLVYILESFTDIGLLRNYGKSFGYKTPADRIAVPAHVAGDTEHDTQPLNEEDEALIRFVSKCATENGAELNIGQIVRGFFKVKELEKSEFYSFITRINHLVDQGYFIHTPNSSWYTYTGAVVNQVVKNETANGRSVPNITTRPIESSKAPEQASITGNDRVEPDEVQDDLPTASAVEATLVGELLDFLEGLSEREKTMTQAILSSVNVGEWFQQKAIEIDHIFFKSEGARRQAFSLLFGKLVESGLLQHNGIPRGGKKYMVIESYLKEKEAQIRGLTKSTAKPDEPKDIPQQDAKRQPSTEPDLKVADTQLATRPRRRMQPPAPEHEKLVSRKAVIFAAKIAQYITVQLEATPDQREKYSVISKSLADQLKITESAAKVIIKKLIEDDHFYFNGHQRGSKLLALEQPSGHTSETTSRRRQAKKEIMRQWSEDDVTAVTRILDALLTKTHVQQGLVISKMISSLEISAEKEEQFRRSMRKAEAAGYIVIKKNTNYNTRSDRSKKIYQPAVLFPSQQAKERWKSAREEVVQEFQALLNG